jgi:DNA processing protein
LLVIFACARIRGMEDLKYWVALSCVPLLGTVRFRRLETYFGDLRHAWEAGPSELKAAGIEDGPIRELLSVRDTVSPDAELAKLERASVRPIPWSHPEYPWRLKEIPDPPPVLYIKGTLQPEDEKSVAVVGTRAPTVYGKEAAAVLIADLARSGLTIVSGLARGVDGIAHRAALDNGGRTIAVVANGLDIVYPSEHSGLSRRIEQNGAVISEYPLGVRPNPRSFPRRNRLISGLSLGTLVIEASDTSGTIWTVQHALEQDREVFCIPGSIFPPSSNVTNRMIKQGAKLVSGYQDVLEELNLVGQQVAQQYEMPMDLGTNYDAESDLLKHLDEQPLHIDDIRRIASLPITTVSSMLSILELKGKVKQVGCMHYVRMQEKTAIYGN